MKFRFLAIPDFDDTPFGFNDIQLLTQFVDKPEFLVIDVQEGKVLLDKSQYDVIEYKG